MAKKSSLSIGRLILQIALGVMLALGGIMALQGGKGDPAAEAIRSIFDGNVEKILAVVFGVIELLAGILLVVELFCGDQFGKFDNLIMLIVIVVWIVAIVLIDFLGNNGILNGGGRDIFKWLYSLAGHLIVLGSMLILND